MIEICRRRVGSFGERAASLDHVRRDRLRASVDARVSDKTLRLKYGSVGARLAPDPRSGSSSD